MSLVGDFECARPGDLVEEISVFILLGDQIAVQVVVQVRLWDLVPHSDCVWDLLHDGAGHWCTQQEELQGCRPKGTYWSGRPGRRAPLARAAGHAADPPRDLPLLKYSWYLAWSCRVFQWWSLQFWHTSITKTFSLFPSLACIVNTLDFYFHKRLTCQIDFIWKIRDALFHRYPHTPLSKYNI